MDSYHEFLWRYVYIPLAAFAGAIAAMANTKFKEMSKMELIATVVSGFTFAIFVTPWIATSWFGIDHDNVRAIAGLTYLFGAGSNILLPVLIGRFRKLLAGEGKETVP